jgi:hypothetical protein
MENLRHCICKVFVGLSINHFFSKRGDYARAEGLFKGLFSTYLIEGWYELVYSIRTRLAECQRQQRHSTEYPKSYEPTALYSISRYVASCLGLLAPQLGSTKEEKEFYVDELIDVATNHLSAVFVHSFSDLHPLIHGSVSFKKVSFSLGESVQVTSKINSLFVKVKTEAM